MIKRPRWSEDDLKLLKSNLNKTAIELSIILNRTNRNVLKKIRALGLIEEYNRYNEFNGKYLDQTKECERRNRISNTCKVNKKSGGLRKGSGRGKRGTYKGYWCDSSYELAWVIYHIDHNIKFVRNLEKFKYYHNNEEKNYIPDFIINDVYYETKGYDDGTVEYKLDRKSTRL